MRLDETLPFSMSSGTHFRSIFPLCTSIKGPFNNDVTLKSFFIQRFVTNGVTYPLPNVMF